LFWIFSPKYFKVYLFGHLLGPFFCHFCHFWPFWAILGHFGPFLNPNGPVSISKAVKG
jgi:hypothetical protein